MPLGSLFAGPRPPFADPARPGPLAVRSLISRRNMEPWLPTLLIWTFLMAGPGSLQQALSHFSQGKRS